MEHTEILPPVLSRLRELKHSDLAEVARLSGVPESTLRKLRYGEVKNPRVQTVQALRDYFAGIDMAPSTELVVTDHQEAA
ncbi:helix-turn-helix transcriptional regulator [Achromobacter veterisilvae]|uniref:Helix-turn-helix transcriptional regulator n=1 Tax=Achromobacter veterisilvae TaxID=2069367 RepID=A0ABZ2SB55_9BURK